MPVPLQKRHERLHPVDDLPLLRSGEQPEHSRFIDQGLSGCGGFLQLSADPLHPSRLRGCRRHQLVDEPEEILPKPRNAEKLEAVGALVERHPEAELVGTE